MRRSRLILQTFFLCLWHLIDDSLELHGVGELEGLAAAGTRASPAVVATAAIVVVVIPIVGIVRATAASRSLRFRPDGGARESVEQQDE